MSNDTAHVSTSTPLSMHLRTITLRDHIRAKPGEYVSIGECVEVLFARHSVRVNECHVRSVFAKLLREEDGVFHLRCDQLRFETVMQRASRLAEEGRAVRAATATHRLEVFKTWEKKQAKLREMESDLAEYRKALAAFESTNKDAILHGGA